MNAGAHPFIWDGETLSLLPERAIWWARKKTMFIADPHFGKAAAFRVAGIAVPETSHDEDLERLATILKRHQAAQLVVLGDFLHAKSGRSERSMTALNDWRQTQLDLEIVLVMGNHDQRAGAPPAEWNIRCVSEPWAVEPFLAWHHPPKQALKSFAFAGHLHPAFRLQERGGFSATSVCFHFQKNLAILPAFGNFTGKHMVAPSPEDHIFLIDGQKIVDATPLVKRRKNHRVVI